MTRRGLLQGMLAAGFALPAAAGGRWTDVLAFLGGEQSAGTFPGASLIASRQGQVRFERQLGTYCGLKQRDAPVGPAVIHPLFSFSKLVSATVVAMAQQEGLLDYDRPVSTYIPEFTGGG